MTRRLLIAALFAFFAPLSLQAQTTGPAGSLAPTTIATRDASTNNFRLITVEKNPGAASVALAGAGAGNTTQGAHKVIVQLVTSAGHTSAGTTSATVTVTDNTTNGRIAISGIPTGSVFTTSRKVYMSTVAAPTVFRLLSNGTIADNTTTTLTANDSDATLGAAALMPTGNTTANPVLTYTGSTGAVSIAGAAAGTVTTSGSPASPQLAKFSSATAITTATATDVSTPSQCADAGANDTYACSLAPALASYVVGTKLRFFANTANTAGATINFNALGALTIVKMPGGITTALATGDINAGQWVEGTIASGSNFQMTSQVGGSAGITNSAGANVVPKSDGTNLVASRITDAGAGAAIEINSGAVGSSNIGDLSTGTVSLLLAGSDDGGPSATLSASTESLAIDGTAHTITATAATAINLTGPTKVTQLTTDGLVTTSGGTGALSVTVPGTGVATFLATPSSANLAAAVTGETGTGALVFGTSPNFTTQVLGPDGSASLPGYAFTNQGNTGLMRFNTSEIAIVTNGVIRWSVNVNGHLVAPALDNTYDIGTTGAVRPRTGYFGTSLIVGAPTGGDKGAGTINTAGALWMNGVVGCSGVPAASTLGVVTTCTSSEQFKNVVGKFTRGLDALSAIQPIRFFWKQDNQFGENPAILQTGFSAENVRLAIPEAVWVVKQTKGQEYLTLSDRVILGTVVNSINQLNAKIKTLEAEIRQLKTARERD